MYSLGQSVSSLLSRFSNVARLAAVALVVVLATVVSGQAQERQKPTNLKVLDTTITHDQLMYIMGKFTTALGVGCDHCHARAAGGRDLDFASDSLKTKLAARAMLVMVNKINGDYLTKLPVADSPRVAVECVTCHRGQSRPILIQDALKMARREHGMNGVDSVYRALRKQYYGSDTYDFSDLALVQLALDIQPENNQDALQILKLNREFNPQSAVNEWAAGRVYVELADTANAIAQFKKALEINPSYRRAQRELQMLGASSKP